MKIKNSKYNQYIAVVLFVMMVCGRPMILGNLYAPFSLILMAIIIFFNIKKSNYKLFLKKEKHGNVYKACLMFFLYCLIQGMILSDQFVLVIQEVIYLIFATSVFYLCFLNNSIKYAFIKLIYIVLIIFSISYAISITIALSYGWSSIHITSFDYGYVFTNTEIFFPFTTTYGHSFFNGIVVRRLLGFARECGLMQVFYVWAFFMADKYFRKTIIVKIVLGIGVCGCFSTAGFIVFGISLVLSIMLETKKILSINTFLASILIICMVYVIFYAQGTSLSDKAEVSISGRTEALEYGIKSFIERPIWGYGFCDTLGDRNIQIGICAISSMGQIGIVGFMLWLNIWWQGIRSSKRKKRFLYANAALFITALLSQPIMNAPMMYWFFFTDFDDTRILLFED